MDTPCYNCTERHMNCHSECDEYMDWKYEISNRNKKIAKQRDIERQADARSKEAIRNFKRRR